MRTECDTTITTQPDRDRLRGEWQRVTLRAGWPARVAWHSDAVEQCLDAFVRNGHAHTACLALARDRAAAEIPLDVALAELDALFLCGLAHSAPGALVQAYLSTRARANPPGTLPPAPTRSPNCPRPRCSSSDWPSAPPPASTYGSWWCAWRSPNRCCGATCGTSCSPPGTWNAPSATWPTRCRPGD